MVYQFRVDEAPYPWQETHLKEGKLRTQTRLVKEMDSTRLLISDHDTPHEMTTDS